MNILVIPSIRENYLKYFFDSWKDYGDWDSVVVIEDNPKKTFDININCPLYHYSHEEIQFDLKEDSWIISKKDSACRVYGFLIAKRLGAQYVLSLDDDCCNYGNIPICASHLNAINSFKICKETIGMRSRGFPYRNFGKIVPVCNMGLWTKVGDWSALQSLSDTNLENYFLPQKGSYLAHPNHRYPFCGMNIFFNIDVIPAMYFPLMGIEFFRYDDIWAGWIFQKIFQHLGLCWSIGEPFVEHSRASDVFTNLVKEASGLRTNEMLWELINSIVLSGNTVSECVYQVGNSLELNTDQYLSKIGKAIKVWVKLCEKNI